MTTKLFIFLAICCFSLGNSSRIYVDPKSHHFVDEHGRVRLFHGYNSVIKGFPWYDPIMLTEQRIKDTKNLGFNVIRLGAMWSGVIPTEGQVNKTYIKILQDVVQAYGKEGILTILDMHQDVLWQAGSNENQGYWGVPKWIKDKLEMPQNLFPWPFTGTPWSWECGYLTEEVSRGFGQFYRNVNGVADEFAQFWQIMALEFKDFDSVLGYELINEPFAGDLYEAFSIVLPGLAGSLNLAPLYERASKAIREVDTETLIFYEPVTWGYFSPMEPNYVLDLLLTDSLNTLNIFDIQAAVEQVCGPMVEEFDLKKHAQKMIENANVSTLGTGFNQVPGGPEYNNRSVLSWHYYCELFDSDNDNTTVSSIIIQFFCDVLFGPDVFHTVKVRTEEIGGGSMLTEFGLCYPNITDLSGKNTVECNRVMQLAETHFQSWTYWDTDFFWQPDTLPVNDLVAVFSRPYPRATSGMPRNLTYDIISKDFFYEFNANPEIATPTEIYVPPLIYPKSQFDIHLSDSLSWKFSDDDPNIVFVDSSQTKEADNPVYVRLSPVIKVVSSWK